MFRETTAENVKTSLTKQYHKWVDDQLKAKKYPKPFEIKASFGIPDLQKIMGATHEIVDHDARTTVKDAGLADDKLLATEKVVSVKLGDAPFTLGGVTFNSPAGRVFLTLKNGAAKLFNRKFTETEVNVIYDVLMQISKNVLEEKKVDGETKRMFQWLRSTVFWGIHKNIKTGKEKEHGFNNVWFEKKGDNMFLFIVLCLEKLLQKMLKLL